MPNSLQPTLTKTVSMHAMFTQEKLELLSQVNQETHASFHLVMTRLKVLADSTEVLVIPWFLWCD